MRSILRSLTDAELALRRADLAKTIGEKRKAGATDVGIYVRSHGDHVREEQRRRMARLREERANARTA